LWRRLLNEELYALYSSSNNVRVIKSRRRGVCDRIDAYRVLVGKPERRRPLERPRHRWEDGFKIDLQEVG
jgi:hypothetical protein